MCRRNGREEEREESVAAVQKPRSDLKSVAMKKLLEAGDGDESIGIGEAGPTAFVYSPASRETTADRLFL